jgi:pimeloyl-ACP methyl ester carboxylesterase
VIRRVAFGLLVTLVVLSVATASALACRAWLQHHRENALAIRTPNRVQEGFYVRLGDVDQWIQIRGEDRCNPVLLFIHGGPGSSETPMSSRLRLWERQFTVVMWDQRGAGKTFARNRVVGDLSLARVTQDGIELTQFLQAHLQQSRIIALGHSWGSMVGLRMVHDRPELYSAYVGTGQIVSIPEAEAILYAHTVEKLRAAHDAASIATITVIGPPPYRSADDLLTVRALAARYDIEPERDFFKTMAPVILFAPGWSLWDIYQWRQGFQASQVATLHAMDSYDARQMGATYAVPIFIINGAEDQNTPTDLAQTFFDGIRAPEKQFVVLKGGAHNAVLTEPDAFLHELVLHVRPTAVCGAQ